MTKLEKATRSFNYACKQASKCRHERIEKSCFACEALKSCDIQQRLEAAHDIMKSTRIIHSPIF